MLLESSFCNVWSNVLCVPIRSKMIAQIFHKNTSNSWKMKLKGSIAAKVVFEMDADRGLQQACGKWIL